MLGLEAIENSNSPHFGHFNRPDTLSRLLDDSRYQARDMELQIPPTLKALSKDTEYSKVTERRVA